MTVVFGVSVVLFPAEMGVLRKGSAHQACQLTKAADPGRTMLSGNHIENPIVTGYFPECDNTREARQWARAHKNESGMSMYYRASDAAGPNRGLDAQGSSAFTVENS